MGILIPLYRGMAYIDIGVWHIIYSILRNRVHPLIRIEIPDLRSFNLYIPFSGIGDVLVFEHRETYKLKLLHSSGIGVLGVIQIYDGLKPSFKCT